MEKRDFDEQIKGLLSEFEENYDPSSWDSFEEKLDIEEQMDGLIKESLDKHEEPFNEEHWNMLMTEYDRRKEKKIIQRVAEFVILLLLIFTTQNFIQYKSGEDIQSRDKIFLVQLDNQINLFPSTISLQKPRLLNLVDFSKYGDSGNNNNSGVYDLSKSLKSESALIGAAMHKEPVTHLGTLPQLEIANLNTPNVSLEVTMETLDIPMVMGDAESIASLGIDEVTTDLAALDLKLVNTDKYANSGIWLSLVSEVGVNFINSPFDLSLVKNPIQSRSGSISVGATASMDFKNIEVVTGFLYSEKSYFPSRIRKYVPSINEKYVETSLQSLDFEQIQIPLMINYHSPRILGVSAYLTGGIGVNIITNTVYDIETQVRSFSGVASTQNLDFRDLPVGTLQGGSIRDNLFATGIVGFGIEKRFNKRFAFNISSTYQRSLSGQINSIINRTQQLGLNLGVKVNLK